MIHNDWLRSKGFEIVEHHNGEKIVFKYDYSFAPYVTFMFDDMTENTIGPCFEFYLRKNVCLEMIYLAREGI